MKLTKNAAALLLAASLAVSVCAMPVFAADPNMGSQTVDGTLTPGNKLIGVWDTQILYKVTESYTWTVPATIDFGENAGVGNTSTVEANLDGSKTGKKADADNQWKGTAPKIMVTKNVIGVGKNLQITVDTEGHTHTSFDQNDGFYVETSGTTPTESVKLYFKIQKNDASKTELTKKNNEVLRVPSGTNTAEQELVFTLKTANNNAAGNAAEKAGKYEGHVVFSSQIV